MTTEALRTKLDALQIDMQRLMVENARLCEENADEAARVDAEQEAAQVREESEHAEAELEQLRVSTSERSRTCASSADAPVALNRKSRS